MSFLLSFVGGSFVSEHQCCAKNPINMRWQLVILLLFRLSTGEEADEDLSDLLRQSNNSDSFISPRKAGQIRFEGDPQYPDQEDLSNVDLDDQPGQPFRFEESGQGQSGRVTFQDDNGLDEGENYVPNQGNQNSPTRVTFQDDNKAPQREPGTKKRRRRRRRKPRYQLPGQYTPGLPVPLSPGQYPGGQGPKYPAPIPLNQGLANPGQPQIPNYQGYPAQPYSGGQGFGPPGGYYRPQRRPRQSFASEALSRVADALTSIALYDDYQCVPRLLCEAAGGGALGSSPVFQSIAGLQPLLTLLSAYNGISTSPLFVFGRAVFLGMTSKGNTASCRYAYSQCPTDPEQLVHYLNNHNGGFFRFFNSPQPQIPQNVEQFYNQLSGQYGFPNPGPQQYGIYDPQNQAPLQPNPQGYPQNYGLYNPQFNQDPSNPAQQYDPYRPYSQGPNIPQQNPGYPYPPLNHQYSHGSQYGLYNNQFSDPNFYANKYKYGSKYPHASKYGFNNVRYKDSGKNIKIQKRIQNKPSYLYIDSDVGNVDINSKWIFPENSVTTSANVIKSSNNIRGGKNLKFPEENLKMYHDSGNDNRKGKTISFPESQSAKYEYYYEYTPVYDRDNYKLSYQNNNIGQNSFNNFDTNYNNSQNMLFNYNQSFLANGFQNNGISNTGYGNSNRYSKYMYNNDDEDGVQTVYIVRGNGDPNNPEIIKVRPGERLML